MSDAYRQVVYQSPAHYLFFCGFTIQIIIIKRVGKKFDAQPMSKVIELITNVIPQKISKKIFFIYKSN